MVQRSKHTMSPGKAAKMQRKLRAFHHHVRRTWCGEVPIGEAVYVSLDALNSALILTDRQLQGAIDGTYAPQDISAANIVTVQIHNTVVQRSK